MAQGLSGMIDALRAVAEPTRLRLLAICSEGELTVSEITHIVGQSQPRVSRHLKLLCNTGLLIRFREGHFVLYRVPAKGRGADLVQQLLRQLPRDDEQLELDNSRMESVKAERARRAADYLRFNSEDWARLREANVSDREINQVIVDIMNTDRIGDLLDIGTGTGRMLKLLGKFASSAVGVDIAPEMLAVARSNLHAAGLGKVMVRRGDMYGLPYPDSAFDTVTLDHLLHLAEDAPRVIREVARVLRPNGQILVVDFSLRTNGDPDSPGISDESLETWFEAGGLRCAELRHLKGQSLNVVLSVAVPRRRQDAAVA
ncbi:MAG: metalloregulator ArsR/SmtB family transcription factor [Gammaproteobacteria bacterium]|nr:metalloregulator ArsR/SmtB family transcription factor [Gammaproteobacteria bacterium]MDH3767092.1 metalloregulator ArsR/SmtB family transcription factor [Gammaproteobacteria bacterium]